MAKDVEINVKSTGLKGLKQELKEAKDAIIDLQNADVVDPAKIQAAIERAGKLKDDFNDINEQVKVFSGGSDFEKVSDGLGLIGSQLRSFDFEGAAVSAKNLTSTIKGLNPQTVAAGFKGLTTTVGQLGNAFFQMGLKLLANPIFLIVAVITAVVVAIVLLKDKVKILEQAFDFLMAPINILIKGLKDLGDLIGITSFAEEEAAKKAEDNAKRRIASNEAVSSNTKEFYDRQIALAKANGKDTTDLEAKSLSEQKSIANNSLETTKNLINGRLELLGIASDEEIAGLISKGAAVEDIEISLNQRHNDRTRAQNKIDAQFIFDQGKILTKQFQDQANLGNQIGVLRATEAKKRVDLEQQTANLIENIRINALDDGRKKELEKADEVYKEKLQADIKNIDLTEDQKTRRAAAFQVERAKTIKDINKKYDKEELDQKLASDRAIIDARIAGLQDGFEKEIALNEEVNRRELEDIDRNEKLKGKAKEDAKIASDLKLANANQKSFQKELADGKAQSEKLLKEREDLDKKLKDARKDFDDYIFSQNSTEYQKEIRGIQERVNDRIKIQEDAEDSERQTLLKKFQEEQTDTETQLNELSDLYEKYYGPEGIINKIKQAGDKEQSKVRKTLFGKETSDAINAATTILDSVNNLIGQLSAAAAEKDQQRITSIEDNLSKQNDIYDKQRDRELSQQNLSEAQKNQIDRKFQLLKYKQELAAFAKTEEIKKKAFQRDKEYRLVGAIMDTASAVLKALNSGGNIYVGIALAAIAAATGAVQIATIASQKYQGEAGPSAPNIPTGSFGGASEAATPNLSFGGGNPNGGEASAPKTVTKSLGNDINISVNVGVDEVTNTQNRVARIIRGAELSPS